MSYRYARSNGQFLASKITVPRTKPTDRAFRFDQAYDLNKEFVTGSKSTGSFISKRKLTGYASAKNLVAWWRFDVEVPSLTAGVQGGKGIVDSSANNHTMSGSASPAFVQEDTPSVIVQRNSLNFEQYYSGGWKDEYLITDASDAFTFSDGVSDKPFSVAGWVKFPGTGDGYQHILSKMLNSSKTNSEWAIRIYNKKLSLTLFDSQGSDAGKLELMTDAAVFTDNRNKWVHIVATYDGSESGWGLNLYVNGAGPLYHGAGATIVASSGYGRMRSTPALVAVGPWDGETDYGWNGQIAELAIWKEELTADTVKTLYGVTNPGCYRLVRDFSLPSPDNDTRVLEVVSKDKGFDVSGILPDIIKSLYQGVNVRSAKDLINYATFKIRPNSGFVKTLGGKDLSRIAYDDSLATTQLSSPTDARSLVQLGGVGRLNERFSHEMEQMDLGQTAAYETAGPFEDMGKLTAVGIVKTHPLDLVVPMEMVSVSSAEAYDGVIEPLTIRSRIDGTSTEGPFYAHEIRGLMGYDVNKSTPLIEDGFNMDEVSIQAKVSTGMSPFLDSVESIGSRFPGVGAGSTLDMPGAFSDVVSRLTPFVDYDDDRDKEYTTNGVSSTISRVLTVTGSLTNMLTHDKMMPHGFRFVNNPIGIDSIAYGGLKK